MSSDDQDPVSTHILVIPKKDSENTEIPVIYKFFEERGHSIAIEEPKAVICPLKLRNRNFYIILPDICCHSDLNLSNHAALHKSTQLNDVYSKFLSFKKKLTILQTENFSALRISNNNIYNRNIIIGIKKHNEDLISSKASNLQNQGPKDHKDGNPTPLQERKASISGEDLSRTLICLKNVSVPLTEFSDCCNSTDYRVVGNESTRDGNENFVVLNDNLKDLQPLTIRREEGLSTPLSHNPNINHQKDESIGDIEITSENFQNFTNIKSSTFIKFVISRYSQIEKARDKRIWNIVFTSKAFQKTANLVEKYIHHVNHANKILVYKSYLVDCSYERLIALDNVEVIVLIDCPSLFPFENKLHVPVLTPFDVFIMFGNYQDINYFPNKVFKAPNHEQKPGLDFYKTGLLPINEIVSSDQLLHVPFSSEKTYDEIVEGRSGIASKYRD